MSEDYLDMTPEEFQELLTEFLTEGDSHLQVLNEKLLQAEESIKSGIEMGDEDMNAMFRAAHTVKGTASFINLKRIVKLTHEMETILQRVKERQMSLTLHIVDVLFKAFDTLESLFSSLRDEGEEKGDIEPSVALIREVLDGTPGAAPQVKPAATPAAAKPAPQEEAAPVVEATPQAAPKAAPINEKYVQQFIVDAEENIETFNEVLMNLEKEKDNTTFIHDLFRCMHTIKGASGIVNALEVQAVSHAMENVLSHLRQTQQTPPDECISLLFEGIDMVRTLIDALRAGESADINSARLCEKLNLLYSRLTAKEEPSVPAAEGDSEEKEFSMASLSADMQAELRESIAGENDLFEIQCVIDKAIGAKSMKLLLIEEKLAKNGLVLQSVPSSATLTVEPSGDLPVKVHFCSAVNEKNIRSILSLDGVSVTSIERLDMAHFKDESAAAAPAPLQETLPEAGASGAQPEEKEKADSAPAASAEKKAEPVSAAPKKAAAAPPPKSASIEISTIRVDSHKIDNLMNLSGELVITRARFSQLVNQFNASLAAQKELMNTYTELKDTHENIRKEFKQLIPQEKENALESKKVFKAFDDTALSFAALDRKMDLSNTTTCIHTLDEVTGALGKIASDIQTGVMQTRMIPIEGIFTRFKRVVRDISKSLGKEVNLKIEGEDTELDKKIVDSLGDPLTHMIRNACDHGIEDTASRIAAGKPEVGTVLLRASHKGNSFCIDVGDDGKGLDAEKIAASAINKGIVTPEQVEKMSEKEKLHLVFAPGFSTAEKVTGISGRGVGMDVVKNMITSVNGVVDIETQVGKGTTFVLKIPLTLAIIQALLVVIGEETFAFPLETVVEIIKVSGDEIYSIDGTDTVKLRDHALSVVELKKIIHVQGSERLEQESKKVVVISDGEHQIGVVVDSLIGEDEIVIKSLTEHFAGVIGITGASILGDGRIALILDPYSIIREANRH
jgi:two-component system, chemotaxis family, sensor kinase CheA